MSKHFTPSTILVTGGAGFIGSHVCEKLLAQGKEVICIDNLSDYYSPKFKLENLEILEQYPLFHFHQQDVRNVKMLEKIFVEYEVEAIIHLAACVGIRASWKDPLTYEDINVKGTLNLLEMAKNFKIKNFIFSSSSSVYGLNPLPFCEDKTLPNPISPYAATKLAAESLCRAYANAYDLSIKCLRFFTAYGPRGRPDMAVYKFVHAIDRGRAIEIYGDGSSKRDYTYVEDIVDGVTACLKKNFKFEIFNLGSSKMIELKELVEIIENSMDKKAIIQKLPPQLGDLPSTCADISKAKKLLNYKPSTTLEEGISKFIKWFREKRGQNSRL